MVASSLSPDVPAASSELPVFAVRNASIGYDGAPVISDVSFTVRRGETVAIMGANGSGKSTLLRALLRIIPVTSGSIEVYGTSLREFRDWGRIGYVPQRLVVGGGVPATVRETVTAGRVARKRGLLPFLGAADRAAVTEALTTTGLLERSGDAVQELSGGQQQRVLIARALAGEPDVLVMDEPMAGVDAANQRALAHTLDQLAHRGHTIVLVLHELGPLAPLIHRSVVLSHGQLVHDGAPPQPVGECALPDHDHVHPHADNTAGAIAVPAPEGLRLD